MNKFIIPVLCCSTILFSTSNLNAKEPPKPVVPHNIEQIHHHKPDLAKRLNLSEEQKNKADVIRARGREEMKKLHQKMQEIRQSNMEEFEKILTPEQKEEFEKIKSELKTLRKKPFPKHKHPNHLDHPEDKPLPPASSK